VDIEGLAAATARRIATEADISERTFFNYYPVKEDAILGLRDPTIGPSALHRFASTAGSRTTLARAVTLLADTLQSCNVSTVDLSRRRTTLDHHPDLRSRLVARITDARGLVHQVLVDRQDPKASVPVGVVSNLAGAIISYSLQASDFDHFPTEPELLRATALFEAALAETPSGARSAGGI
jgi:AcrR family transcriptional regulator